MHRSQIKKLLNSYLIAFDEDGQIVDKIASFIDEQPDCFERSLSIGHITGSSWIVNRGRSHALFTHHRKLGKWLQLGGHCDGEADVCAVALREAREESGLLNIKPLSKQIFDVDIHTIPANSRESEHYHYDIRFIFEADSSEPLVISHESKELSWIELSQIEKYTKEWSVLRMVQKMRTLESFLLPPLDRPFTILQTAPS